ncbi:Hypothetical predicted protein [Podarcis lilfordi]|uniref:Uncharacterized protein n=1 Tax=Podarcis lilfordi TaxID=74358 RepID=A0AA35PTN0_9SAUR|nr:Hypothetical predicted protein [Podarcis lilfordi]
MGERDGFFRHYVFVWRAGAQHAVGYCWDEGEPADGGEAMEVLDQCLDSVMDWKKANKLKLNPDKIEALLVAGSLDQMAGRSPALEGVTLPLKEQDTHAANPEVTGRLSVATPAQERAPAGRTCAEAGYHRSRMCRSGPPPHSQKWATAPRTCAEQAHLDTDFLECTRTPGMN